MPETPLTVGGLFSGIPSEGLNSGWNEQVCGSCGTAIPTTSADMSSLNDGQMFLATQTCENCATPPRSMFSVAVFPAKTSALPEGERGSLAQGRVFGRSTRDSFVSYDPVTSSWRMSPRSLFGDSEEFSGTWPRAGMTRSGTASRLVPLVPLTAVTASGSLPTPQAEQRGGVPGNGRQSGDRNLASMARYNMWPTPRTSDTNGPGRHGQGGLDLRTAVQEAEMRRWPTPRSQNGEERNSKSWSRPAGQPQNLENAVAAADPSTVGGQLNPTWVEWLMGYPPGWTVSVAWETRSSRKSRKSSGNAS